MVSHQRSLQVGLPHSVSSESKLPVISLLGCSSLRLPLLPEVIHSFPGSRMKGGEGRKGGRGCLDCDFQQVFHNASIYSLLVRAFALRSLGNVVLFQKALILAKVRVLLGRKKGQTEGRADDNPRFV